jgi:hypothetical protein
VSRTADARWRGAGPAGISGTAETGVRGEATVSPVAASLARLRGRGCALGRVAGFRARFGLAAGRCASSLIGMNP